MTQPVVMLVAGLPGAGKTTLIDRAAHEPEWTVVDTDRVRRRMPAALRRLRVPYPLHMLVMVRAIARHTKVVVQSRGTYVPVRRLVTSCARVFRREAVLVLLDAPAADAVADQAQRGRSVSARAMRWHTARWRGLLEAADSGALHTEGWSRVLVIDRAQAAHVEDLDELLRPDAPSLRP